MTLSPSQAQAITPRAWDTAAAKRRQAERIGSVGNLVLRIMSGIEKNVRRGCTDDGLGKIVADWAGPRLASFVKPAAINSKTKTLKLEVRHTAAMMELKGRLPALKVALKGTGVERVTF